MSSRSLILKRFMGNDVLAASARVPHNFRTNYGWRYGFCGQEWSGIPGSSRDRVDTHSSTHDSYFSARESARAADS